MVISQYSHVLSLLCKLLLLLLYSSTSPQTSQDGSCVFAASLSSLSFSSQSPTFLSHSHHNFLTRPLASTVKMLKTINLSVHNFVSRGSSNCIPKCE